MTIHTRVARLACLIALVALGTPGLVAAQSKVGILPFGDATASGHRSIGADIARTLQAEMVHSTSLQPRVLEHDGAEASGVDAAQAVELGRAQHVDFVFVGTVLEARTEQSNKRGWMPAIKGQSATIDIHHLKSIVVLQGELYNVANGERMFSARVTGNDSSNSVGGTVYTSLGSLGNDSYQSFLESPLGKALQAATAEMTKKVAAATTHHS